MKYTINYGTGVIEEVDGTLDEAKKIADDGATYTQENIKITDEKGNEITIRTWCGVGFDPDLHEFGEDADVIRFGNYGYFNEWVQLR